jgi:hypothetical protein
VLAICSALVPAQAAAGAAPALAASVAAAPSAAAVPDASLIPIGLLLRCLRLRCLLLRCLTYLHVAIFLWGAFLISKAHGHVVHVSAVCRLGDVPC